MSERPAQPQRGFRHESRTYDVLVVGGGMAGLAAAVSAAREGVRVALIQDRPVLGGNASSEIRVNMEGANGGRHNRFFVESGLAEDLLLLNFWRNPTGQGDHWSALLLDLALSTEGLDLYLDTIVKGVSLASDRVIESVDALTLAAERSWTLDARYFVDATGDGTVAYLAGASFMSGEEAKATFGEPLAPDKATDLTLGATMWFICKDTGRPVAFEPPSFARKVTDEELTVNRSSNVWGQDPFLGGFWWIEYGGDVDTIYDNEHVKLVLLSEVFGLWDYVKNRAPDCERNRNLDLEWVAAMPGKRESRRITGDHVLTEHDIMENSRFDSAVAFGGWSIDRHTPRGFLDFDRPPCVQVHPPALYQIPLECLYTKDLDNLYLVGRDISSSHVGCCSARVMLTCAHVGEAVGVAAAMSARGNRRPRDIAADPSSLSRLRGALQRRGHYIPNVPLEVDRLPGDAVITASSQAELRQSIVTRGVDLTCPRMLSLPLSRPDLTSVRVWLESERPLDLAWRVHGVDRARGSWLPGDRLAGGTLACPANPGGAWVDIPTALRGAGPGYVHLALATQQEGVTLGVCDERPLGPLTWRSSRSDIDAVPRDLRTESGWDLPQHFEDFGDSAAMIFSYWCRDAHGWGGPPGPAIAFEAFPAQPLGEASSMAAPYERPTPEGVHAWCSDRQSGTTADGTFRFDRPPCLTVELREPVFAEQIDVYFNSDVDRHLANLWYCHPVGERAMSTLIADAVLEARDAAGAWREAGRLEGNHDRRWEVPVGAEITGVRLTLLSSRGEPYASVMDLRLRTRA